MQINRLYARVALRVVNTLNNKNKQHLLAEYAKNVKNVEEALEFFFDSYFSEWWKKNSKLLKTDSKTMLEKSNNNIEFFLKFLEISPEEYNIEYFKINLNIKSDLHFYIYPKAVFGLGHFKETAQQKEFSESILSLFFSETLKDLIKKHFKKK